MSDHIDETDARTIDATGRRDIYGIVDDDDGQAIDQFFEPRYNGPVSSESYETKQRDIKPVTRILNSKITVGTIGGVVQPVQQLFPRDANRTSLTLRANGPFLIGSALSDIAAGYGAVYPANDTLILPGYTGAVWVYSTDATAVVVNAWAVTS